jgi:hypothetical protein
VKIHEDVADRVGETVKSILHGFVGEPGDSVTGPYEVEKLVLLLMEKIQAEQISIETINPYARAILIMGLDLALYSKVVGGTRRNEVSVFLAALQALAKVEDDGWDDED